MVLHRLEAFPQVENFAAVGHQRAQPPLSKRIEPGLARDCCGRTFSAKSHVLPWDVPVAWAVAMDCLAGMA